MNRIAVILIACCLHCSLQASDVKLPAPPYWIDGDGNTNALRVYPFILAIGPDPETGRMQYEAPPAWMLAGPPPARMRFKMKMQTSTNLVDWGTETLPMTTPATNAAKFYRPGTVEAVQ